jgi:hypothetical protein
VWLEVQLVIEKLGKSKNLPVEREFEQKAKAKRQKYLI